MEILLIILSQIMHATPFQVFPITEIKIRASVRRWHLSYGIEATIFSNALSIPTSKFNNAPII